MEVSKSEEPATFYGVWDSLELSKVVSAGSIVAVLVLVIAWLGATIGCDIKLDGSFWEGYDTALYGEDVCELVRWEDFVRARSNAYSSFFLMLPACVSLFFLLRDSQRFWKFSGSDLGGNLLQTAFDKDWSLGFYFFSLSNMVWCSIGLSICSFLWHGSAAQEMNLNDIRFMWLVLLTEKVWIWLLFFVIVLNKCNCGSARKSFVRAVTILYPVLILLVAMPTINGFSFFRDGFKMYEGDWYWKYGSCGIAASFALLSLTISRKSFRSVCLWGSLAFVLIWLGIPFIVLDKEKMFCNSPSSLFQGTAIFHTTSGLAVALSVLAKRNIFLSLLQQKSLEGGASVIEPSDNVRRSGDYLT